jgi:hypothetical protein
MSDEIASAGGVVLNLSFRRNTGGLGQSSWQTGFYGGSIYQTGLWQVPVGMSLRQAQGNIENLLCDLSVLREITPDEKFLAKLQVEKDGSWQVRIDLDGDGSADVDLTSDLHGKPYDIRSTGVVTDQSGLVISVSPSFGIKTPNVGHTYIPINYLESVSSKIETPTDRRPIELITNLKSQVSPATIEGQKWSEQRQVAVTPSSSVSQFSNGKFFAEVPLSPSGPTNIVLEQSGTPATTKETQIIWEATNLADYGEISIRKGDSILFSLDRGYETYTTEFTLDFYGNGSEVQIVAIDDLTPVTYDEPGVYYTTARSDENNDGIIEEGEIVGQYVVNVTSYQLPEYIAAEKDFVRNLYLDENAETPDIAVLTSQEDQFLALNEKERGINKIYLTIKPLKNNEPVLEARLGSSNGPLLASEDIETFVYESKTGSLAPAQRTYPDGSVQLELVYHMKPWRPGLDIQFKIFVSGAAFDDGSLEKWVPSEQFTLIEGDTEGTAEYRIGIIRSSTTRTGPCHATRVFQREIQVGK